MTTMADHNNSSNNTTDTKDTAVVNGVEQLKSQLSDVIGGSMQNGREARNLAEKQRRDKLNASIQELATIVPHVAESTRRLDKTAVLRFATHGLRLQYVFGKSASRRRRRICQKGFIEYREPPQMTDSLMQLLDSFFLTLTCNGQIVLISASIEQLLGHCQSDLYGQNILQITHPDDQALLRQQLIPRDIESLFVRDYQTNCCAGSKESVNIKRDHNDDCENMEDDLVVHDNDDYDDEDMSGARSEGDNGCNDSQYYRPTPSPRYLTQLAAIDERLRADRRCFTVRLARASTRSEATRHYELVKIDGCFRRSDSSVTNGVGNFPIVSQLIRRSRSNTGNGSGNASLNYGTGNQGAGAIGGNIVGVNGVPCLPQHDAIAQAALHGISGNDIVLVAMGRILREQHIIHRQPEANQLEYRTRHLIDGRIIDCDQRIGIVAGYMKDEVRNLSPFSFMHQDDVRWVIVALRQMYDCNSDYGESCYRLLSRNGHFIYLQTRGYLEIDKSSNQVHSFLCVNTLLNEEEGKRKVQEMKNKFSTIINAKIPAKSSPDLPASRNPQQLERIVLYLIENLHKSNDNNESTTGNAATITECNDAVAFDAEDCGSDNGGSGGCINGDGSGIMTFDHDMRSPGSIHDDYIQTPSPQQLITSTSTNTTTPLALVPPEPSSVKNSITKSVNVVNITAAKTLQYKQQRSPSGLLQYNDNENGKTYDCKTLSKGSGSGSGPELELEALKMKTQTPPSTYSIQRSSVLQRLPLSVTITPTPTIPPSSIKSLATSPSAAASAPTSASSLSSPSFLNNNDDDEAISPISRNQEHRQRIIKMPTVVNQHTNNSNNNNTNCNSNSKNNHNECSVLMKVKTALPSSSSLSSPSSSSSSSSSSSLSISLASPSLLSPTLQSSPRKLHAVLSSSFRQIDSNLQTLGEEAQTLYNQRTLLVPDQVPCTTLDRQLDAILVEHQRQKQLLINIKSEYDVHLHQQLQQQQQTQHLPVQQQQQQQQFSPPLPNGPNNSGSDIGGVVDLEQQHVGSVIIGDNMTVTTRQNRQNRRPL